MSTNQAINQDKELEIVSMLARGDKYESIAEEMNIAVSTVGKIKARNSKALAMISQRLAEHKARKTAQILDKANDLLENKLDKAITAESQADKLWKQYTDGFITLKEYTAAVKSFDRLSLPELTSVSKEMFSQNKIEESKLGGGSEGTKAETEATLNAMLEAMNNGDTVTLQQIVFQPRD